MKEFLPTLRGASRGAPNSIFKGDQTRSQLIKNELASARAANDAKTARLRALRLEKERQDEAAAAVKPAIAPLKEKRKPIRRISG
jgi:hypothetical protein